MIIHSTARHCRPIETFGACRRVTHLSVLFISIDDILLGQWHSTETIEFVDEDGLRHMQMAIVLETANDVTILRLALNRLAEEELGHIWTK